MSNKENKNPLLTLLIIINFIAVIFIFYKQRAMDSKVDTLTTINSSSLTSTQKSPYLQKAKDGSIIREYNFGSFTANLARNDGPQRYLTIDVVLYLETLATAPLLEIENKKPDLRDEVLTILNTVTPQEALKLEGRGILKNLLKNHINNQLKSDQVKEILFTKFTVN